MLCTCKYAYFSDSCHWLFQQLNASPMVPSLTTTACWCRWLSWKKSCRSLCFKRAPAVCHSYCSRGITHLKPSLQMLPWSYRPLCLVCQAGHSQPCQRLGCCRVCSTPRTMCLSALCGIFKVCHIPCLIRYSSGGASRVWHALGATISMHMFGKLTSSACCF